MLGFLHVQVKARVLGLGFAIEPVRPNLAGTADPPLCAHQPPVFGETRHNLHAITPVQIGTMIDPGEIHPYPHILAAMSCSSLPTASA